MSYTFNGNTFYSGNSVSNVSINNGRVFINGKLQGESNEPFEIQITVKGQTTIYKEPVNIKIEGNCTSAKLSNGDLHVAGDCGSASSSNGKVTVEKNCTTATSSNGNITIGGTCGHAHSSNGNVRASKILN
jgi:hypothetical protein